VQPAEVLGFWFGDAVVSPARADARSSFWFGGTPALDAEITARFGAAAAAARSGALDGWTADARGALAVVILIDQFSRNVHRGAAAAFAADAHALAIAQRAIDGGLMSRLAPIEQGFLAMPFQHAESRMAQQQGIRAYERIVADAPFEWRGVLGGFLVSAREHAQTVERFGRFPHRNAILGRASTSDEEAFLAAGAKRYGQAKA
jgi:uncharacterized protein (DUF924 family)